MKWDGAAYVEYIKHGLTLLLSSLDRQNALTLSHKEFTDFFQRAHSGVTQCIPPEKIGNQSIVMSCGTDKVVFDFQRPLNNLGDREIYLTWSMAARHVRYWVAEDRMAVVAHEQKELKDYSAVIRTKLNDAMLAKEYTYRCGKAADTPSYRAEADERRAYLCAKELYIRGFKNCLSEKHRGMLETAEELGDPTLYPSGTKLEIEKETEENNMTAAFDLGAMLGTPAPLRNEVKQIPCDMLIPYHNHKFTLYEGERLDDMVESIRTNGVLIPIIVQPVSGGKYEILIGHNRWNASKLAGLPTVPAIIKEGLTEEEAEMYVIESNLLQRSFSEMKISEQAAVIAMRHSKMFSQGKRNDIIRELEMLNGSGVSTSSQFETKLESGDSKTALGSEYGMSRASVARLIRISKLIPALQERVDSGVIALNAAVELSYLSEETQELVSEQAADFKIDMKKSKQLRQAADSEGNIDTAQAILIIGGLADVKPKVKIFKMNRTRIEHFFEEGTSQEEIENTIELTLTAYFGEQVRFEG